MFWSYRTTFPESWPGLSRLVPAIHAFPLSCRKKDVDARDKRGHDGGETIRSHRNALYATKHGSPILEFYFIDRARIFPLCSE